MDFLEFFFTTKDKVLETTLFQVFTIKWFHWEWFSFEVSW